MRYLWFRRGWLPGSASVLFCLAMAAGPTRAADTGQQVFTQQCGTCHVLKAQDGPRAGPPLAGVFGRQAGSVPGFEYSDALRKAGFRWDAEKLDRWLSDTAAFVPDSVMNYHQDDAKVRQAIIAYLRKAAH